MAANNSQSTYTGPGLYQIIPVGNPNTSLNVEGRVTTPGAKVIIYTKFPEAENSQWEIVAAGGTGGQPEIGDREYHIIGVQSGLFLTSGKAKEDQITLTQQNPLNPAVRWKLVPAKNGAYYINAPDDKLQLNIKGPDPPSGTIAISYPPAEAANCQFYLRNPAAR